MYTVNTTSIGIPFSEVQDEYEKVYEKSSKIVKIKLKCWYYDCQGYMRSGRDCPTFKVYKKSLSRINCIQYIKGYLIDVKDLGGYDEALNIATQFIFD